MDNSFRNLVDSAKNILILLPSKPYLDQVAAGLGLYLCLKDSALQKEGRDVSISCPMPMVVGFNHLLGINKISPQPGNKNLVIKFNNYQAANVERVSADVVNGELHLKLIPNSGAVSPQKEQIEISYAGVAADLVILVGGGNTSHFPALTSNELKGTKVAHIGTGVLEARDIPIMSFARVGSSVSEVVYAILKENTYSLDADSATNLIAGIEEGSRNFQGQDVTAETFQIAADLLLLGGRRLAKERFTPRNMVPGSNPAEIFAKQAKPAVTAVGGDQAPQDWFEPKIFKGTSVS